ncbi:MAG: ABC transporter substrate-binding protein [Mangrovicoccus sp.]|nr:ABC transporter substrate-binding protein [Mangrovicoccus sp.]
MKQLLSGAAIAAALLPASAPAQDRVVVIGPALVEIAYALGAADRIIGTDDSAARLPQGSQAANIGYFRNIPAEGVLALAPDLVITAPDAAPSEVFDLLAAAGVPVAYAPHVETPKSVPEKILFMGEALALGPKAAALAKDYAQSLAQTQNQTQGVQARKLLFVMALKGGAPLVAGRGTAPHTMFEAAGFDNAASAIEGYQAVGAEALITMAPDGVVMMPPHAARAGGISAVMDLPGFAQTPAKANGRYITMEGAMLMRFGPRTPEALEELQSLFAAPQPQ